MEKADIKKKTHLALVALLISVQKGTGFSTSPSALTSCASSTANVSFNFSIDVGETIFRTRIWFFGAGKIAESDGTTLTPVPSYSSRLTAYGTSGISLSNITVADAGTYTYVIVLLPTGSPFTATTALSVQVAPLAPPSGCQVSTTQSSNILTCAVNTDSGNCGTPSLNAFWVNSANTSSQLICNVGETYQCCATSVALTCYSGSSNDFCKQFTCTEPPQSQLELGLGLGLGSIGIPIVITIIVVVIFIWTEVSSVQTYVGSEAHFNFMLTEDCNESEVHIKNKSGGVVMIARGKVGRSGDPVYKGRVNFTGNTDQKLISFILRNVTLSDAGIYTAVLSDANRIIGCQMLIAKGCKRPYILGLVLGLGLGITFIVGCIIIVSLMSTGTTPCKNELGLGLGLGSGMPCVITIIIAVIIVFCSFSLFEGIPNIHEFGEGILDGFVIGIIVKRLKCTNDEDNPQETDGKKHEQVRLEPTEVSSVQTYVGSEANFSFMLTEDSSESEVHIKNKSGGVVLIAHGKEGRSGDPVYKSRVNFTGNTDQKLISFILRNVTLSDAGIYTAVHSDANRIIGCQMLIVKDTKGMTKNPGPHKVQPNTISEQTNYRQQLLPPVDTEFEDAPYRRLPQPPQNGEIQDRNLRGISATIDDTPGLANETPQNKLPPLPIEPKKKRKKRQKNIR